MPPAGTSGGVGSGWLVFEGLWGCLTSGVFCICCCCTCCLLLLLLQGKIKASGCFREGLNEFWECSNKHLRARTFQGDRLLVSFRCSQRPEMQRLIAPPGSQELAYTSRQKVFLSVPCSPRLHLRSAVGGLRLIFWSTSGLHAFLWKGKRGADVSLPLNLNLGIILLFHSVSSNLCIAVSGACAEMNTRSATATPPSAIRWRCL